MNPWTEKALADDLHLGDPVEAAIIVREGEGFEVLDCGRCGGKAYFRPTVGAFQCWDCRAILLVGPHRSSLFAGGEGEGRPTTNEFRPQGHEPTPIHH